MKTQKGVAPLKDGGCTPAGFHPGTHQAQAEKGLAGTMGALPGPTIRIVGFISCRREDWRWSCDRVQLPMKDRCPC